MKQLQTLLEKEISRKQFVTSLVAAVVGVTGLPTFLGLFTKNVNSANKSPNPGYGERGYGP